MNPLRLLLRAYQHTFSLKGRASVAEFCWYVAFLILTLVSNVVVATLTVTVDSPAQCFYVSSSRAALGGVSEGWTETRPPVPPICGVSPEDQDCIHRAELPGYTQHHPSHCVHAWRNDALGRRIAAGMGVWAVLIAPPSVSVMVRRLHDTGRSGTFFLTANRPSTNKALLEPGDYRENAYGPNPIDLMDEAKRQRQEKRAAQESL